LVGAVTLASVLPRSTTNWYLPPFSTSANWLLVPASRLRNSVRVWLVDVWANHPATVTPPVNVNVGWSGT
jgi:hypothetical protein